MVQGFYGNRVGTQITAEEFDRFMLGYLSDIKLMPSDKVDRSMIPIPHTDNIVAVYNKFEEQRHLENLKEHGVQMDRVKPSLDIPELGIRIYSRVIVCRLVADGEPASLLPGDSEKFIRYLPL